MRRPHIRSSLLVITILSCATIAIAQTGRPRKVNDPAGQKPAATANEERLPTLTAPERGKPAKGKPSESRPRNLPYRVEIGEGITQPGAELVVAIGRVTVVHCPEAPLQVLLGKPALFVSNPNDPGLPESVEGNSRSDFYLRPVRVGRTNLVIEMMSATVDISVRIVEVDGGARVGDYHGEVYVRLPKYREDNAATRLRLTTVEKELAECGTQLQALKEETERSARQAEERAFIDGLAAFQAAASGVSKTFKAITVNSANVRQVTSAVKTPTGSWWLVIEIENKDKSQTLFIQELGAERSRLYVSGGSLRGIGPKQKMRVAIALKPGPQVSGATPPALSITIQGAKGTLTIQP